MELNIAGKKAPTSFDVSCSNCSWTGVATLNMWVNLSTIAIGGKMNFSVNGVPQKCPACKVGEIYAKGGKYKRNVETNHMERIGDFEK